VRRADALLVFDEVIRASGARGGAQERFGVVPDLTVLGKIVGEAAAGGVRRTCRIMEQLAPVGAVTRPGRCREPAGDRGRARYCDASATTPCTSG
jgi:glutamate-1-semialdehyde 2,1-aminomutase